MADIVMAPPYTARYCEECDTWISMHEGPIAEGDPTKTLNDTIHWQDVHWREADPTKFGRPYMRWNVETVRALVIGGEPS